MLVKNLLRRFHVSFHLSHSVFELFVLLFSCDIESSFALLFVNFLLGVSSSNCRCKRYSSLLC